MKILAISSHGYSLNRRQQNLLEADGLAFRQVRVSREIYGRGRKKRDKLKRYLPNKRFDDLVINQCDDFNPDIIHISSGRALTLNVLRAVRNFRNIALVLDHGAIGGFNRFNPVDRMTFGNSRISKIIAPSKAAINNWMSNKYLRSLITPERCDVLYHAVSRPVGAEVLSKKPARERLALGTDKFVIGTTCNYREIKNIAFVAELMPKMAENTVFCMIGSPPPPAEVKRLEAVCGDRVRFSGQIRNAGNLMSAFDVYVSPTRYPGEAFGLATAEAMSLGIPALTTMVGGSAEIVEHRKSGFILPPNQNDWLNTMEVLRSDATLRGKMGEAAAERIRTRFAREVIAADLKNLYQRVLSSS